VKSGSVLPVAGVGDSTESSEASELTVRIYGDGFLPWRLGEKAGLTLSWDKVRRQGIIGHGASNLHKYRIVDWKEME
jgi:hypothetical protein